MLTSATVRLIMICGIGTLLFPSSGRAQPFPTRCASEGSICSISPTTDVAFGSGSRYIVLRGVRGTITCNSSTFGGDPTPGVAKACYTATSAPSQQGPGPAGYATCANESGTCSFSGAQDVAYGAAGQWAHVIGVSGSIGCNNSAFGAAFQVGSLDPAQGYAKACYIPNAQSGSGPMGFGFCNNEGGSCDYSGHSAVIVAIGANNRYYSQTFTTADSPFQFDKLQLPCQTGYFALGDPYPGVTKACYVSFNSGPGGYTNCAIEGFSNWNSYYGTFSCALPFSGDWVLYGPAREGGTSGTGIARFYAKTFSGSSIHCYNGSFSDLPNSGDPAPNYLKFCYVR